MFQLKMKNEDEMKTTLTASSAPVITVGNRHVYYSPDLVPSLLAHSSSCNHSQRKDGDPNSFRNSVLLSVSHIVRQQSQAPHVLLRLETHTPTHASSPQTVVVISQLKIELPRELENKCVSVCILCVQPLILLLLLQSGRFLQINVESYIRNNVFPHVVYKHVPESMLTSTMSVSELEQQLNIEQIPSAASSSSRKSTGMMSASASTDSLDSLNLKQVSMKKKRERMSLFNLADETSTSTNIQAQTTIGTSGTTSSSSQPKILKKSYSVYDNNASSTSRSTQSSVINRSVSAYTSKRNSGASNISSSSTYKRSQTSRQMMSSSSSASSSSSTAVLPSIISLSQLLSMATIVDYFKDHMDALSSPMNAHTIAGMTAYIPAVASSVSTGNDSILSQTFAQMLAQDPSIKHVVVAYIWLANGEVFQLAYKRCLLDTFNNNNSSKGSAAAAFDDNLFGKELKGKLKDKDKIARPFKLSKLELLSIMLRHRRKDDVGVGIDKLSIVDFHAELDVACDASSSSSAGVGVGITVYALNSLPNVTLLLECSGTGGNSSGSKQSDSYICTVENGSTHNSRKVSTNPFDDDVGNNRNSISQLLPVRSRRVMKDSEDSDSLDDDSSHEDSENGGDGGGGEDIWKEVSSSEDEEETPHQHHHHHQGSVRKADKINASNAASSSVPVPTIKIVNIRQLVGGAAVTGGSNSSSLTASQVLSRQAWSKLFQIAMNKCAGSNAKNSNNKKSTMMLSRSQGKNVIVHNPAVFTQSIEAAPAAQSSMLAQVQVSTVRVLPSVAGSSSGASIASKPRTLTHLSKSMNPFDEDSTTNPFEDDDEDDTATNVIKPGSSSSKTANNSDLVSRDMITASAVDSATGCVHIYRVNTRRGLINPTAGTMWCPTLSLNVSHMLQLAENECLYEAVITVSGRFLIVLSRVITKAAATTDHNAEANRPNRNFTSDYENKAEDSPRSTEGCAVYVVAISGR
jgi:hypothetical protein